jgi:fibronectin-binding autotransporter adhesin
MADGEWSSLSVFNPTPSSVDNVEVENNVTIGSLVDSTDQVAVTSVVIDSSSSLTLEGSGALTTSDVIEVSGTLSIHGGTLTAQGNGVFGNSGGTLDLGDGITLGTAAQIHLVDSSPFNIQVSSGSATITGVINELAQPSSLDKIGAGTLILTAANTYTGGTTINVGVLEAENNTALGTGAVTVNSGGTLAFYNGTSVANNITISGTGSAGQGALYAIDPNVFVVVSNMTGMVTLAANASVGSDTPGSELQLNSVNLQTFNLTTSGGGRTNFNGDIIGSGGLIIDNQTYIDGGSNTFIGLTDVLSGADLILNDTTGTAISGDLTIENNAEGFDNFGGELATTTVVTLNGNGELLLTSGDPETIAGLVSTSTTSQINLESPFNQGATNLTLDGSGTYVYAGQLTEDSALTPLGLVKDGTGSQELDAANGYSGGTTLNDGTLIAGNAGAFGSGLLTVAGGELTVGNGNHTISVASYAQTAGELLLNVAGTGQAATPDQLHVTNSVASNASLGGNLTANLANFTAPPVANHVTQTYIFTLVDADGGYNNTFASTDAINLASGLTATFDYVSPDEVQIDIAQQANGFSIAGLTSNQQNILAPINSIAAAGTGGAGFASLVNALTPSSNNPAALGQALDELSPQAFGQFTSETAFNNASFETQAMDGYLESQRGADGNFLAGNGAIDASGLTVNDPSYDPNLAMIHSRMLAWNPGPVSGTISDIADPLMGGVDMKDSKQATSTSSYTHPWNFFIRGNVILAQGFSGQDTGHFDDNTESVVLGADYRITPHFLVGLTAGYAHTDATLDNNGSSATVDSYSPGFYASYANEGWYANLTGDYLHNAYTQDRVIGVLGQTASSAPEGNEGVANFDDGYDFHRGAFTFGPLAGIQYTHLSVDGYNESGSAADLSVDDSQSDSLRSRLGGHVSYAFSHDGLTFTPHLDASWQHEFLDQSRGITSQFNGFGGGSFDVRTINPSRESALVDAGFNVDLNRTVTVFTDYTIQAGQDNYFGQSVQAGVKIGF